MRKEAEFELLIESRASSLLLRSGVLQPIHPRNSERMNSNRELYKFKSRNGLGSRETRARLKTQESKNSRDALLFSKRRIPLSSVQEEPPKKKGKRFSLKR